MENKINTKIVITVSRNKKLLNCLRKLDSGEAAIVNVEINYAYKKKPIKLSFIKIKTPTKTSDDFLVYAEYRSSKFLSVVSSSKVVLGSASIKNIQESGFVSIGNKEAKECVIINTYSKNDSPDFRELKKVLLDIMELEDYTPSNCTPHKDISNSTILIELKPENSKIINYEVSIVPAVKTGKVRKHSVNPSVSQEDSSLKENVSSGTVKEKITTMASFVFSRDAYKYAKRLNKILSVGEIDIQADSFTKIGKISSFKSAIDIKSNNHIVVAVSEIDEQIATDCYNRHESSQFAVGALFEYQDYTKSMIIGAISKRLFEVKQNKIARKNLSRALKTTTEGIPPIRKRYMVVEEKSPLNIAPEGSSGLNYTQLMLKKRHESKTESHIEEAKKEENNNKYITVAFECTLEDKEIVAKLFLQRNFRDYSIEFNTITGNFSGEIKSVSIEKGKVIAWTEIKVEDAKKLNLGQNSEEPQETYETIKALLNLEIIEKPKREVGKLYYKLPFPIYAGSVSMDNSFLKVESTVEHKEKSPISRLFPEMSIKTIDNKIKTKLASFSCLIPNTFIHGLTVKDNNSIDTENLSAIFEIGNKVFNGTIVRASIDTDSKIVGFPLSSHISTMVSLEILIDNDSKKIIQNLLDKTDLETAAVGKLMLRTTINDNINYEFTDIHKSLQQIGVIWANKHALLNNKHSSSDKADNPDRYIHTGSLCNCGFCTIERNKPTEAVEDNKNIDVELIVDTYSHEDVEKLNSRVNPPYKIDGKSMDIISVSESKFAILSIAKGLANMMREKKKRVDCSKPSIKINIKSKCGYSNRIISVENIATMYDHANSKYYIVGVLSNKKIDSLKENKDNCINVLADGREEAKDVVNQLFKEINKSKYFPKTLNKDEDCLLSYSERLDKILEYRSKIETLMLINGSVKVKLFKDLDVIKTFNISRVGIYYSNANKEYVLVGIK